jgi:hypothetical protein
MTDQCGLRKNFFRFPALFRPYISGLYWTDPYQGTTSVVPTITAGVEGFSPCSPGRNAGEAQASACEPVALEYGRGIGFTKACAEGSDTIGDYA